MLGPRPSAVARFLLPALALLVLAFPGAADAAILLEPRTDQERLALNRVIYILTHSPTAAKRWLELERSPEPVRLSFQTNPRSLLAETEPSDPEWIPLSGDAGWTEVSSSAPVVNLDDKMLRYSERAIAPTLAHEVLGHVYWNLKARRAGWEDVFIRVELDEMDAVLFEAVVRAELNVKADHPFISEIAADPQAYQKKRRFFSGGYAISLSLEEAADPVAAYKSRLKAVRKEIEEFPTTERRWKARRDIARHFVESHKESGTMMAFAVETTDFLIATSKQRLAGLRESETWLQNELKAGRTPKGRKELERLTALAKSPIARDLQKESRLLHSRLKQSLREWGRFTDSHVVWDVDWSEVQRRAAEDMQRHPDQLKAIKDLKLAF
ncbi:MAG: hypothetical protein HY078_11095 [Elusimicrobia bacterium]|nr:hypothetical protein [Elusimicrobiota bacterium]